MLLQTKRGQPRPLEEGEMLFFTTNPDNRGNKIDIRQADPHFHISAVNLDPGQYPFRGGLIYHNGERRTVFTEDSCNLIVRRP
jgi:hypothetical protein